MDTLIVAGIVGLWLLIFIPMAIVPFLTDRGAPDAPPKVVSLSDRRRGPKQAA